MRIVKAYRLGSDDYATYTLPSKRKSIEQIEASWAKVYDLVERREIEGGVPLRWERIEK
jgi:hypothetical protein